MLTNLVVLNILTKFAAVKRKAYCFEDLTIKTMYIILKTSVCRGHVISTSQVECFTLEKDAYHWLVQHSNDCIVDIQRGDGDHADEFTLTETMDGYSDIYHCTHLDV